MASSINKPLAEDQKVAGKSVAALRRISGRTKNQHLMVFQVEGTVISVPRKAVMLLEKVLDEMADGKSVEIISSSSELSTQEAADFLKVSRPHLVKPLETGKIPYKKVGSHRRILPEDIQKYDSVLREKRRKALDLLAQEAQEMGLGY
ncbi:helix-turn-helix domain-containing protein [Aquiflexum sp. LQ15W]|uniref:helix-turn-helix domain-containing protein n=1 Tax=Cognataquiflexum nitidum TaxID=2922272 RepID=UPI001F13BB3D|nr:helix-turn-helix domain-containing protein [Cognataquiflexum nitidum]MCH6201374.1 helix-turn-helix domain-containing protein [Cognataquiflexum nitidum]